MDSGDYFPSRFLRGDDLEGDMNATVKGSGEEIVGTEEEKEQVLVIYFDEFDKGLILNKTNWEALCELAGSKDTDKWPGTVVGLTTVRVSFKKKLYNTIRIMQPVRK